MLSKLAERGEGPTFSADELSRLGMRVEPLTAEQAVDAARLRPIGRRLGLSLGDRLCLALARERGLAVLTADRQRREIDFGIEVRLAR